MGAGQEGWMGDGCDASPFFEHGASRGGARTTAWGPVPDVVPNLGGVVEIRNAAKGEEPFAGSLTPACWQALNEVLIGPGAAGTCAGWWTGWHMDDHIAARLGAAPRRYTLVEGSDLDWDLWACTAGDAERAGTRDGHFQSPSLWFSGPGGWLVLGFPTTTSSYVSADAELLDAVAGHRALLVDGHRCMG